MAIQLRRARTQHGAQDSGTYVQEGHDAPVRLAIKTKQERVAQQVPARMNGIAQHPFVQNLEAPHRAVLEIPDDQAELGLSNQQVDVRDVARNGVLDGIAKLKTETPAAAVGPEWHGAGGTCQIHSGR